MRLKAPFALLLITAFPTLAASTLGCAPSADDETSDSAGAASAANDLDEDARLLTDAEKRKFLDALEEGEGTGAWTNRTDCSTYERTGLAERDVCQDSPFGKTDGVSNLSIKRDNVRLLFGWRQATYDGNESRRAEQVFIFNNTVAVRVRGGVARYTLALEPMNLRLPGGDPRQKESLLSKRCTLDVIPKKGTLRIRCNAELPHNFVEDVTYEAPRDSALRQF